MSHQLPPLPEPAQQQQYVCTKCGKTGPGSGEWHNRLDGSPCGYMGLHHGPWFTADQMRAYAELSIASVKREPLIDCYKCGLPMSENPHPDAGIPSKVLEVGVQKVCIPCLTLNRHNWAERASKSENDARRWRKLCALLDTAAEENGEFPSAIHEAFQMGGETTCDAIDAYRPVTATTASREDSDAD